MTDTMMKLGVWIVAGLLLGLLLSPLGWIVWDALQHGVQL